MLHCCLVFGGCSEYQYRAVRGAFWLQKPIRRRRQCNAACMLSWDHWTVPVVIPPKYKNDSGHSRDGSAVGRGPPAAASRDRGRTFAVGLVDWGTSVTTACARMRDTEPRNPEEAQNTQSLSVSGALPTQNSGLRARAKHLIWIPPRR